jgi:outer membrane lipoprotein SlyB
MVMKISSIALAVALLAGCETSPYSPGVDEPAPRRAPPQQRGEQNESPGVVENVREVQVDTERTGAAPMIGAVVGGAVGSNVGQGRGSSVGAVVGTVLGSIMGEAAAVAATEPGLEITVKLDEGRSVVVTQPVTAQSFAPGDRVRVVSGGRAARVVKLPPGAGQGTKDQGADMK